MAAELGKRLLAEVEEVGLDEILRTLRRQHEPEPSDFGLSSLDDIINLAASTRTQPPTSPPILELNSQAPGSGTTHLLYHLTATAILPSHLKGQTSCVAILDTDNTFSVSRLVDQIRLHLPPTEPTTTLENALQHVHIFRPQSQTSLIATLEALPAYFLTETHPSRHRPLAFIAVDSLTAFHWQTKASEEDAAFSNQHQPQTTNKPSATAAPPPQPTLPTLLQHTSHSLSAPLLLTTHNPTTTQPRSQIPSIRLKVSRRAVKKFPPAISVAEALRESGDRQRAVGAAGWECRVSEEQRALRGLGFEFRITGDGVDVLP